MEFGSGFLMLGLRLFIELQLRTKQLAEQLALRRKANMTTLSHSIYSCLLTRMVITVSDPRDMVITEQ